MKVDRKKMIIEYLALLALMSACASARDVQKRAVEHNVAGVGLMDANELDRARGRFEMALEFNPRFAEPYNNLGIIALKRGETARALDYFSRAVDINSNFGEALNNLGWCYMLGGDLKKAESRYRLALNVDPDYLAARQNLANVLILQKRWQEAREQAIKVLEVNAGLEETRVLLALTLENLGRTADAISEYMKVVETGQSPESVFDANYNLGLLLLKKDRCSEADPYLSRAATIIPSSPDALAMKGVCDLCLGRRDQARGLFTRALEISADHGESAFNLGLIQFGDRDYEGAFRYLSIPASAGDTHAMFWLCETMLAMNESGKAKQCFEFVLKMSGKTESDETRRSRVRLGELASASR